MVILLNAIYRFNAIPKKILMTFFTVTQKPIITFMWKHKRLPIAKAILSKRAILEVTQYVILNNTPEPY
jgi:hypothetical protein